MVHELHYVIKAKSGKTVVTISVALNKMQKYYLAKIANYYDNLGYFNSTDNVTDPDIQKPKQTNKNKNKTKTKNKNKKTKTKTKKKKTTT